MKTPYEQGVEDGLLQKQAEINRMSEKIGRLQAEIRKLTQKLMETQDVLESSLQQEIPVILARSA